MKENKYYTHVNFFLPFCYISEQRSSWRRNKYYTHVNFFLPFCYISEQRSSWRRINIIPTSISSSHSVIFQSDVFHEGEQIYPRQFLPFCYISEQRSSWRRTNIIPTSISSSHSVIFQNNVLHEGEQILYPRQFLPPILLYFRTTFFMKENKYYTHVNFFLPFCYIFRNNVLHEGEQILYPRQFLPFCYISEQRFSWRRTNIIPTSISSSRSVIFQNNVLHEGEQILYPRQFLPPILLYFRTTFFMKENKYYTHVNFFLPFCYISERRFSWRRINIIPTSISSSRSVIFQNNVLHEGEQILYPRQFLPPILLYFRTTFFMKENKYYTHVNFFLPFCYISEQRFSWRRTNIIPTSISSSHSVIFQNNVLHEGEQILYPRQFLPPFCYISERRFSWRRINIIPTSISSSRSVIFQNNVLHEGEQILYPRQFLPPILLYFRTTFFMKENKYYTHVNFFPPILLYFRTTFFMKENKYYTHVNFFHSVIFQNNILHEGEQILYPRQFLPPVLLYFRTTFFMKENKYYTHVNFFLPFCYISEQRSSWRRTNIIPTSISSSRSVIFQNNILHEGEQILYPRQFLPPVLLYFKTTFFMKENKYYTHVNFFLPFCYISEQRFSWRRTNIIPTSISSSRSVIFQNNVLHEGE